MKETDETTVRDPVCEMKLDMNDCRFKSTYEGKEYGFCSDDCMTAFYTNPEKYMQDSNLQY